jgi:hypothetical protein
MKFEFTSIPELEYKLILSKTYCTDVSIIEDGLVCELMDQAKYELSFKRAANQGFANAEEIIKCFHDLVIERENVLTLISKFASQIYPYIEDEIAEENQKANEPKSEPWDEKVEEKELMGNEEDIEKESPIEKLGEAEPEGTSCIRLLANDSKTFESNIRAYLEKYSATSRLIIESVIRNKEHATQAISQLANLDIIACGSTSASGKILVAFDICPQRLALAMNPEAVLDNKRSDIYYLPPMVSRVIDGKGIIFHAYRSVDDYPVLFPAISMEEKEIGKERESKFQQEITDATKILYKLKKGRRGLRFPLSELSQIIAIYIKEFPIAIDKLSIVDLGTGRGGVLKNIINAFIEEHSVSLLDNRSTFSFILNDSHEEERTGEEFIRYATSDTASQYIKEIQKAIGDLGKAIKTILEIGETDICFMNRVLDMYARYGFYLVDAKSTSKPVSAAVYEETDKEYRGIVLTYNDLMDFTDIYNLQRQLIKFETVEKRVVLPGVSYDLTNDFLKPRGISLDSLVTMSKLVIITVFPATENSLFKKITSNGIHICPLGDDKLSTQPMYVTFCLSKDKSLIDEIAKQVKSKSS